MGSIIDGQPVNASVTNTSKLDRQTDDTAFGIITLANPATASGATVDNVQGHINSGWQDEKLYLILANDGTVSWDGVNLTFTEDIQIVSKDYSVVNTISASNSPLVFSLDGYSAYITLNRLTSATVIPLINATLPKGKDIFRIATRIGSSLVFWDNTYVMSGQTVRIGASGGSSGGGGSIKVDLHDCANSSLPTGVSAVIDGVTLTNNMDVLFTALGSGNNRVYRVTGVGVALAWSAQIVFDGSSVPFDGAEVRVKSGTAYAEQLGVYSGTKWLFTDKVRVFNDCDYYELNNLVTVTLNDNTTDNVFTVGYVGSEHMVLFYSVTRATESQTGQLLINTDGTTVNVADVTSPIGDCGVTFTADISGPNIRLRYTTTSTGSAATMKLITLRWSNAMGGPAGLPSYSVGISPIAAAGSNTQIQFNSAGLLGADSDFTWISGTNTLGLGGISYTGLSTATLVDNISSNTQIITFDKTLYRFINIDYSIERNGAYRMGVLQLLHDDTNASVNDFGNFATSTDVGITFDSDISGSNVRLLYTSTNTGFNGTLKYSVRKWI